MDLRERVRARVAALVGRPRRAAPTATLQVALRAGPWSAGAPGLRLARLCLAAGEALRVDGLLAARRAGESRLEGPREAALLRVGVAGGRCWIGLGRPELALDAEALALRLGSEAAEPAPDTCPGLEVLDLSTLGALEWRGVLLGGRQGRLCLLAPRLVPLAEGAPRAVEALGLALDFDAAWIEPGRAADFLASVAAALGAGRLA